MTKEYNYKATQFTEGEKIELDVLMQYMAKPLSSLAGKELDLQGGLLNEYLRYKENSERAQDTI